MVLSIVAWRDLVAQMLGNRDGYVRAKGTSIFLGHCEGEFQIRIIFCRQGLQELKLVSQISSPLHQCQILQICPSPYNMCDVDDGVVPAGLAKASAAAFQGVGIQDVTLKTYPKWVNQQLSSVDFIFNSGNIVNFLQQIHKQLCFMET